MDQITTDKQYKDLILELKSKIQQSQYSAIRVVNQEMIMLYWNLGRSILEKQTTHRWGSKIIEDLSRDLQKAFPEMKGFSERNLKYMKQFANIFDEKQIGQQPVAQIPWGHHVFLMNKIQDKNEYLWYIKKSIENGWSRSILMHQVDLQLFKRETKEIITNFKQTLPSAQSELAIQTLKDPYIFDFLSIGESAHEREIEKELAKHIQKFLLELGAGFAFVGNQYHLEIDKEDYFIDMLFYHLKLRCYVVIELKTKKFIPEYAGKLNFYLSAVDDLLRHEHDNPTIGIILCKDKGGKIKGEYALKDIKKPIGLSEYKIINSIPDKFKTSLPTIEELEAELSISIKSEE